MESIRGPICGELNGEAFGVARDGIEEDACTESRIVGEEVEFVGGGGIAEVQTGVEGQVQGVVIVEADRGKKDLQQIQPFDVYSSTKNILYLL